MRSYFDVVLLVLANGLFYDIALAPLFFVRGGLLHDGSYIYEPGIASRYWSFRAVTGVASWVPYGAYNLGFDAPEIDPSSTYDRTAGFSLRCLVVGKV